MKLTRLSLITAVLMLSCQLLAQNTGTLSGVVTDPSGAVIEGAKVTVTNQGNDAVRTTTTNASGFTQSQI